VASVLFFFFFFRNDSFHFKMKVYASGYGSLKIDFAAGKVDIFKLHHLFNSMVLVGRTAGSSAPAITSTNLASFESSKLSVKTNIIDIIGKNASQIDAKVIQTVLQINPKVLLPNESVELAFKCGRDSFLFTSHRIMLIDVKGFSGQRVSYFTILWTSIRAFSVETAGSFFDRDAELLLFTNLPDEVCSIPGFPRRSLTRINIDFRRGQADLFAVQRFISDKILGTDTVDPSLIISASKDDHQKSHESNFFSWLGDDMRIIEPQSIDKQFHIDPPILQNCEKVEMAFKGRRDLTIFTSKRFISVDMKGFIGKLVEYTSIPWTSITAFQVQSAGSFMDKDSEMMLWTDFDDVFNPPKDNSDDPPPPPIPRYSYIKIDFQKDRVDLFVIHRYLSERCLRAEGGRKDVDGYYVPNLRPYNMPVSQDIFTSKPGTLDSLLSWLGNDAHAVNASEVNAQFHSMQLFQTDEKAVLAYKCGRDTLILTNKRVFIVDLQGFSGKRVAYKSVPYSSIRSFSVESAGSWDLDAEFTLWIKSYWEEKVKQDLRKGKVDIFAIQAYVAEQVIGSQEGKAVLPPGTAVAHVGPMTTFLDFLGDNAVSTNPAEVESTLKRSPKVLLNDEIVEQAYKLGRDLCIFTTKRILFVDRQGMTGKKVDFTSIPLRYCHAFTVKTAGNFLSEPEVKIYAECGNTVSQDLSKSSSDVWAVQQLLANKIIRKIP